MKRLLMGCCLAMLACMVSAADLSATMKQARASMLLTGSVEVTPDGTVRSYAIDRSDRVPEEVRALVEKASRVWKFEPVLQDGKPVNAKASMSLRVMAEAVDSTHTRISIAGAQFGKESAVPGDSISYKDRPRHFYPLSAVDARVSGTAYLLLRIGRQGEVDDAVAQQVNLDWSGDVRNQSRWRKVLGDAALHAARRWTFHTPTTGKHVQDDYWVARVPVVFGLRQAGAPQVDDYGQWHAYLPGPIQPVMWPDKDKMFSGAPDAIAGDGLFQLDQGLHLATPLNGA